ncbi:MAG: RluA family pseudouridine synthase [Sedimentisphaerales bacterium]|nr:RluA family pseudouridine synthase [Sedimentisphaerales bacterium]
MVPILFEDDSILAVSKPEGVAAIPERRAKGESLLEMLSDLRSERLYVVHRIDKETSGLMVFARNAAFHRWLSQQFDRRTVVKTYLALCHGTISDDRGTIEVPLRQFGSGRVGVDVKRGKPSVTDFEVHRRFGFFTFPSACPHTGRRHQIRVHFYHVGHPIVGDPLYGDKALRQGFGRLMLHAWRLSVHLPSSRTLEASVPESFARVLETANAIGLPASASSLPGIAPPGSGQPGNAEG